jgi:hypothetical protein
MTAPSSPRLDSAAKASQDFNAFLNAGLQCGSISVEHVRVRARQPENEVFVRKALVALRRVSPATAVVATVRETSPCPTPGPAGLAEATALCMEARPALARYLGQAAPAKTAEIPAAPSRLDLFASLHAFSQLDLARRFASAPGFSAGVFTVIGSLSGLSASAPPAVSKGADSIFGASFADVHALSLIAAVDGPQAALKTLDEVVAARKAGGDFSTFSQAPLTRDSSAALQVLRAMITTGTDFAASSSQEMLDRSVLVATEGLAAWMQGCGVDYKAASSLVQGVENIAAIVAAAGNRPAAQARSHHRPT